MENFCSSRLLQNINKNELHVHKLILFSYTKFNYINLFCLVIQAYVSLVLAKMTKCSKQELKFRSTNSKRNRMD